MKKLFPQKKVWGTTALIFDENNVIIHYLNINKKGYCSEHFHKHKDNIFYIISGILKITIFKKHKQDIYMLRSGDTIKIPAESYHIFEAISNVQCIEVYSIKLDNDDIIRRTVGGIRKNGKKK